MDMTNFIATYADSKDRIKRSDGFETVQEAYNWINKNVGTVTPSKLLEVGNGYFDCPITVKDFKNYISGKYTAEYKIN